MPKVYLSRKAGFCASHRLHSKEMSDAENMKYFGKCNNPNGHGHNYILEVTVKGEVDLKTGVIMHLDELKSAINDRVIARFDHKNLNLDVPEFAKLNPTAENIAVVIWNELAKAIPKEKLHEVRLQETENNVAICRGE